MSIDFSISKIDVRTDAIWIIPVEEYTDLSVNMSNSNAAHMIDKMGIEFDYCDHIKGKEALIAAAEAMYENISDADQYVAYRVGQLSQLIQVCIKRGFILSWA